MKVENSSANALCLVFSVSFNKYKLFSPLKKLNTLILNAHYCSGVRLGNV